MKEESKAPEPKQTQPIQQAKQVVEEVKVIPKSPKLKPKQARLPLSKIEFVWKNRFKAGWFTLLSFTKRIK